MRQLKCGAARQDVLVAADIDVSSEEKTDFEAWAASHRAIKGDEKKREEDGDTGENTKKVTGDGQTVYGLNIRTM